MENKQKDRQAEPGSVEKDSKGRKANHAKPSKSGKKAGTFEAKSGGGEAKSGGVRIRISTVVVSIILTALIAATITYSVAYRKVKEQYEYSRQPIVIEESEVLETLKDNLSAGSSVMSSLRKSFKNYLIVYDSKQYIFVPIDYNRKMHDRKSSNLKEISDNEWEYRENGKTVSYKGIDVSSHQGEIDWMKVKEDGVEFAMLRALYRGYESGKLVVDKTFEQNAAGAAEAGIPIGAYLFSQATSSEELDEEVDLLLKTIEPYDVKCPVVMDIETTAEGQGRADQLSMEERTALAKQFCERIKAAGYRPMLYFNYEAAMLLIDTAQLEDVDKWYASYTKDFYYPYYYSLWQYSEQGSVDGIEGDVDMDMSFEKFW